MGPIPRHTFTGPRTYKPCISSFDSTCSEYRGLLSVEQKRRSAGPTTGTFGFTLDPLSVRPTTVKGSHPWGDESSWTGAEVRPSRAPQTDPDTYPDFLSGRTLTPCVDRSLHDRPAGRRWWVRVDVPTQRTFGTKTSSHPLGLDGQMSKVRGTPVALGGVGTPELDDIRSLWPSTDRGLRRGVETRYYL